MNELLQIIVGALAGVKCDLHSEPATHDSIAAGLTAEGVSFAREFRLSARDRLDFWCPIDRVTGSDAPTPLTEPVFTSDEKDCGVVIEVKLAGQAKAIYRQVERYSRDERVAAIVVATARAMRMPAELNGKPVRVVSLSKAWL